MEAASERWVVSGKGELACHGAQLLLDMGFDVMVVPSIPHTEGLPNLQDWAAESGAFCKEDGKLCEEMRGSSFISVFYNRILSAKEIDMFRLCLNVHNSPLPAYRGVQSIRRALQNGEVIHGITVHHIDTGVDTGKVIAQTTYPIWPGLDSVRDVYARANRHGMLLLDDLLPRIESIKHVELKTRFNSSYYGSDRNHELVYKANWEY